jgi:hypothetical protein
VVPDILWAGNDVALVSDVFGGSDSLPAAMMGSRVLAVQRGAGDTILVQLPDSGGLLDLALSFPRGQQVVLPVHVRGFVRELAAPAFRAPPQRLPLSGGEPVVVGLLNDSVETMNLRTGVRHALAPNGYTSGCTSFWNTVMPTADPAIATVVDCNRSQVTDISLTTGAILDSSIAGRTAWLAIRLHPGSWLTSVKTMFRVETRLAGGGFSTTTYGGTDGLPHAFAISPNGNLVVPTHSYSPGQLRVFDASTSGIAYSIPGFTTMGGAAFNDAGDTLFATVADTSSPAQSLLAAFDALTGAVRSLVPLNTNDLDGLILDPGGRWIYRLGVAAITVHDRATLARIATLRAPGWAEVVQHGQVPSWWTTAAFDSYRSHLYLMSDWQSSPRLYQFDVP